MLLFQGRIRNQIWGKNGILWEGRGGVWGVCCMGSLVANKLYPHGEIYLGPRIQLLSPLLKEIWSLESNYEAWDYDHLCIADS